MRVLPTIATGILPRHGAHRPRRPMLARRGALPLGSTPLLSQQPSPERTTADDHEKKKKQKNINILALAERQRAALTTPTTTRRKPIHSRICRTILTLENGRKVTTADVWWKERRPEIVELFEGEVLGRVPHGVPAVTWSVVNTTEGMIGKHKVIGRQIVGHVENTSYPSIAVDIQMALVMPGVTAPIPVMVMLQRYVATKPWWASSCSRTRRSSAGIRERSASDRATDRRRLARRIHQPREHSGGQRRGPDTKASSGSSTKVFSGSRTIGAHLRAWAWGASRALDYLETLGSVDATRVGIEGVSRYGKAALVAMAFDTRFALVLVGSSGEGGTKLHRRNWGEQVENLTGAGEYHWMAGNFMRYGAADASFGSKNAGDIPVDAHQLIALCAPRPTFISYGVPEKGDARWLDHQGS